MTIRIHSNYPGLTAIDHLLFLVVSIPLAETLQLGQVNQTSINQPSSSTIARVANELLLNALAVH